MKIRLVMLFAAVIASAGLVSCGSDPTDTSTPNGGDSSEVTSNKITGSVKEWAVTVSANVAKAGEVSFVIDNAGTVSHEFLVVKTDFALGKIPLGANNRFDEEGEGLAVIDEIPEWAPKTTGTLTVKLEQGAYQLLCNIEGHYAAGMRTAFTVSS